jgi:photosystem II stability/assembly factor-like uncharacterized protein
MRSGRSSNRRIECISRLAILFCLTILLIVPRIYGADKVWISRNNGLFGGAVTTLVIDPSSTQTLYAGTESSGVFKSADGGANWVAAGLPNTFVRALAIDPSSPQTLYAGTYGDGVFKSTDGGANWVKTSLPNFTYVHTLVIDPSSTQILYAGTRSNGMFKSTDGGANWVKSGLPPINNDFVSFNALAIDPSSPQTLYAGIEGYGVFKSTDGGGNWTAANTGLDSKFVSALAIDPSSPQTLYAGAAGYGVFKSTDGGGNWVNIGLTYLQLFSIGVMPLVIDPSSPQTLYVGTAANSIYKSTDGGGNWTAVNTGLYGNEFRALAIDPLSPQTLYSGALTGVFKSEDGGDTWRAINAGLSSINVSSLVMDPSSPQTLYSGSGISGVYKSTDGGGNWTEANTGLYGKGVNALAIDPSSPQTLYAGHADGVFKSTDGGGNWTAINTGLPFYANFYNRVSALVIDPSSPETLYVASVDGVFKSTNGGGSWTAAHTGLSSSVNALVIDPSSPQTLYAASDPGVYKSTNGGGNWTAVNSGLPRPIVNVLAVDPLSPQTLYAGAWDGIYKSTNGGGNWTKTGLPWVHVNALVIDPSSPQTLYAASDRGVFESTNGGDSWTAINAGLPNTSVNALAISASSPQRLYAGTSGRGVWVYQLICSLLDAGGAVTCQTFGDAAATRVGYAKLAVNSGTTPYGTAILSFRQNGVTVAEAGIPASPPTTQARIFIDYRADVNAIPGRSNAGTVDVNTGIALENNGLADANVTYTLRDYDGVVLSAGHGTVAAGKHLAKFIDQLKDVAPDFNLPSSFQSTTHFGSLEIASDQPLSVLALRGTINQRNEFLMTTTPVADLNQPIGNSSIYFPQLADGDGYTTLLLLINSSSGTERGTLQVLDNNGLPLVVNQVGGASDSSFRYSIPSGGVFCFQTDGSSTATKAGWVRLDPDHMNPSAPVASGVIAYNPDTVLVSESGIPAANSTTHARVYVDLSGSHNTGLAVANIGATAANVIVSAYSADGTANVGASLGSLQLAAGGHDARFADQFISGLPAGFTGVLDISSTTPFAALTLRSLVNEREDFLMTAFPVADANQEAPSPVVFPQVADGGGYVTEFMLISTRDAAETTLSLFDENGISMDFGE